MSVLVSVIVVVSTCAGWSMLCIDRVVASIVLLVHIQTLQSSKLHDFPSHNLKRKTQTYFCRSIQCWPIFKVFITNISIFRGDDFVFMTLIFTLVKPFNVVE